MGSTFYGYKLALFLFLLGFALAQDTEMDPDPPFLVFRESCAKPEIKECDPRTLECINGRCRCKVHAVTDLERKNCIKLSSQKYDEPCDSEKRCLVPFVCTDQKCGCPSKEPIWNKEKGICEGRAYKDVGCINSIEGQDCQATLTCVSGTCDCAGFKLNWNPLKKICEGKYLTEPCTTDLDCADLTCKDRVCTCPERKPNWNDAAKVCEEKFVGEYCLTKQECYGDLDCVDEKCACPHGHPTWDNVGKVCNPKPKFGDHCDTVCDESTIECIDFVCKCRSGQTYNGSRCILTLTKTIDSPCALSRECTREHELRCVENKCACPSGWYWINSRCVTRNTLSVPKCRVNENPNECDFQLAKNLVCLDGICGCASHMEYSLSANACKLKAGETCYLEEKPLHDLCASQHCNTEATEPNFKQCACPHVAGLGYIWASAPEHRCVIDSFDRPCNVLNGDAECRRATFDSSREGLVCRTDVRIHNDVYPVGRCRCSKGLIYHQGYCVDSRQIYNETCDPDGVNSTCKIDGMTSLTCSDIGGGDFKCICLPKEHMINGSRFLGPLIWNEGLGSCDLKPNADPCMAGYECKSTSCGSNHTCEDTSDVVVLAENRSEEDIPNSSGSKIQFTGTFFLVLFLILH